DFCSIFFWYDDCYIGEDSVTQPTEDVIATEGGQVTLGCTFNTQVTNPYLFWYKQGANDHPKYMLMRFKVGTTPGDNAADFKDRFHADVDANANSVPLRIQDLQLTDSAVYYLIQSRFRSENCGHTCTVFTSHTRNSSTSQSTFMYCKKDLLVFSKKQSTAWCCSMEINLKGANTINNLESEDTDMPFRQIPPHGLLLNTVQNNMKHQQ
uniref:Ig-like domain-containing protein n=1 Tax=Esox lucius TaxID=8010 RepID=A0AAY5KGZ3_ESOLU